MFSHISLVSFSSSLLRPCRVPPAFIHTLPPLPLSKRRVIWSWFSKQNKHIKADTEANKKLRHEARLLGKFYVDWLLLYDEYHTLYEFMCAWIPYFIWIHFRMKRYICMNSYVFTISSLTGTDTMSSRLTRTKVKKLNQMWSFGLCDLTRYILVHNISGNP